MLNNFNQWLQNSIFKPLEDRKMPVMEHLVELQVRLTRAVIVTAIVFIATFFYADALVKWLRIPLQNMFVPSTLSWEPTDLPTVPFVFLAPAEALWQNVKVAGLFAIVLAMPYILVEIWRFVVPGLHARTHGGQGASRDDDLRVLLEPQVDRRRALVDRQGQPAVGILEQQWLTGSHVAEGLDPRHLEIDDATLVDHPHEHRLTQLR